MKRKRLASERVNPRLAQAAKAPGGERDAASPRPFSPALPAGAWDCGIPIALLESKFIQGVHTLQTHLVC